MTTPLPHDPTQTQRVRQASWHPVLVAVIAICVLIEAVLVLADHGLIGSARWRPLAYQYGAFWAGLLHGWRPNFAAQPVSMFFTYAFLHAGTVHLIGNMLALALLGPPVLERQGPWRFALVYLAAVLGGAATFGLLTRSPAPMVGASGALFGLAGALLVWRWQDQRHAGLAHARGLADLAGGLLGLTAINLGTWWLESGQLAWQTHMGGVLGGALVAGLSARQRPILEKIRA